MWKKVARKGAKTNNGKLPYHDVKERLDEINDLITTHGLIGKSSQGKLKQFSSHLSKDIESSLEPKFKELGADSYKNWKEAKKNYAAYAQEEIPKLNELYKKDKKCPDDHRYLSDRIRLDNGKIICGLCDKKE